MAICIKDLDTLGTLSNSIHLIAGKNGQSRVVRYITIMEVDDFADKPLGEDLLVLTTFSTSASDPCKMEEVLLKLIQKNISGIAIKVNRFLKEIPDSLIKIADQYKTPLFLIDKDIPFRTIISDVNTLIISEQFETIKTLNNQYEDFYTSILKGEDLGILLQKIGKQLSRNCFCFSQTGEMLKQSIQQHTKNLEVLIEYIELLNKNPEMIWQTVNSGENYIISADRDFIVFPCIAYNKILGYFVVQQLNTSDFNVMMNVKQFTSFLSIKLLEDVLKKESEAKFQIQLANEIFYNTTLSEDMIRGKLNLMGLDPEEYYYVLFIEPSAPSKQNPNILNSNYLQKKISLFVKYYVTNFLITDVSDGYILILTFNKQGVFHSIPSFKEFLINLYKIIDIPTGFKIGCSPKENTLIQIANALKLSKRSILLGKEIYPERNIYLIDDYFNIQMIMGMLNTEEHKLIRSKIISPLEKYDKKYKSYLIETLETCLKVDTLQEAAKSLFLHTSSLRYRLEKIHEITGENFFTNVGKYSLTNAYLLLKLEKIFGIDTKQLDLQDAHS
ncbi:PucR family transcriptional regulator ligand-binding domain-containing protein [Neobacillus sp. FSL H8-0543]|uniref:PucR family transcriptional regulator n=1 Tax=Neobacillus sp. FSL H8-0543 TaxID=2954672 RepID=UPI0031581D04